MLGHLGGRLAGSGIAQGTTLTFKKDDIAALNCTTAVGTAPRLGDFSPSGELARAGFISDHQFE
jgi:hypothetical protein